MQVTKGTPLLNAIQCYADISTSYNILLNTFYFIFVMVTTFDDLAEILDFAWWISFENVQHHVLIES